MKRTRDLFYDEVSFQPCMQMRHVESSQVDPISLLMRAAARGTHAPHQSNAKAPTAPIHGHNLVPCTHCGSHLPESRLQQCSHCGDIYCTTCSITNYDSHEDRVFCLECAEAESSRSNVSSASHSGGSSWGSGPMAHYMASGGVFRDAPVLHSLHSRPHDSFSMSQYCSQGVVGRGMPAHVGLLRHSAGL